MPVSETQIENGTFRVTRWELEPVDTIPAHMHEYEDVVVPLTEGTLWASATDGTETAVELSTGQSYARPAGASQTVENHSTAWIMFVEIERFPSVPCFTCAAGLPLSFTGRRAYPEHTLIPGSHAGVLSA